jgi:hypothetical protein
MSLYFLESKRGQIYDTALAQIVRAKSAKHARKVAATACLNEGKDVWLSPTQSTCRILKTEGKAECIMRDHFIEG